MGHLYFSSFSVYFSSLWVKPFGAVSNFGHAILMSEQHESQWEGTMAFKAFAPTWYMPCSFIFHWAIKFNVIGVRKHAKYIEDIESHRKLVGMHICLLEWGIHGMKYNMVWLLKPQVLFTSNHFFTPIITIKFLPQIKISTLTYFLVYVLKCLSVSN